MAFQRQAELTDCKIQICIIMIKSLYSIVSVAQCLAHKCSSLFIELMTMNVAIINSSMLKTFLLTFNILLRI